jgi:hypothetical protein
VFFWPIDAAVIWRPNANGFAENCPWIIIQRVMNGSASIDQFDEDRQPYNLKFRSRYNLLAGTRPVHWTLRMAGKKC